jgi:hypothetical protein
MIPALWDVALLQIVKVTFRRRIILLTFLGSSSGRNICMFFKTLLLISTSHSDFPSPGRNKTIRVSNAQTHIIFRFICNYCFIICVIIDFRVLFHPRYSFYFVCWKSILIWVICVSISLIYYPLLIYAFHLFTCEYMCSFLSTDKLTNIFINFLYVTVISNNIVFYISVWRS